MLALHLFPLPTTVQQRYYTNCEISEITEALGVLCHLRETEASQNEDEEEGVEVVVEDRILEWRAHVP